MKRTDITYQDKLGELILDISHPNNNGINFVLVEGKSDIRLFRKIFNIQKCKVENIPGGNPKLEECVFQLSTSDNLILGIRDMDFIKLNNQVYSKSNMFLTDCHDIEMTILNQLYVLNALLFEYTSLPKEKHIELKENLMKALSMLSCLKWLNDKESLELKFSPGFLDLLSFQEFELNFSEYLKRIISKSPEAKIKDETEIREKITILLQENPDFMQLTNGHDMLNTFAQYFKNNIQNKSLTEASLASSFRMCFTHEHFFETELYSNLLKWSIEHNTELF
jgi:predicted nuclease of predicted toxin-antitoxin system